MTKTKAFMDLMVASTNIIGVVLNSSAALPFFFVWGNTMKCLQPCVTHVYKCTVTSSSASETNPSPLCDVFSVLTVCNEVVVSGSRLCLPAGLSIGVAVYDMFLPTCEDPH